ncbi:MAG: Rieske (2Fe-2S) protein [Phycisphaeraceae bacterium]
MPQRHVICSVDDLPPGERRIVEIGDRSIGVFNVAGTFHALRNVCPHQRAPLCKGRVTGTNLPSRPGEFHWAKEGEIIRCPWHNWEFDITTGQSVFNPHKMRVKAYQVAVETGGGDVDPRNPNPSDATVDVPGTPDPAVETYDVRQEQRMVVLYI